jgi:hypothetical protein
VISNVFESSVTNLRVGRSDIGIELVGGVLRSELELVILECEFREFGKFE